MLLELNITNFAIIDRLSLGFCPGLNVLTGETGAGKSVIIDAVGALLGGKVGPEMVRSGAERAHLEGLFALAGTGPSPYGYGSVRGLLEEHGLAAEEDVLIVSRELHRFGRSVARINGRAVPFSLLQQLAPFLADIHGQSEHLSLLRPGRQLDLLDEYGALGEERAAVAAKVGMLRQVRRELKEILHDERELARRVDLLRFQRAEIAAAQLSVGEEEELLREQAILANAERLAAGSDLAYRRLYEGDERQPAALDLLGQALASVQELVKLDQALAEPAKMLQEAQYQLAEAAGNLRAYRDRVEYNPARLQRVEERLELIQRLKRKYGASIEEILAFGRQAEAELERLVHSEERVAELRAQEEALLPQAGELAARLSEARCEAGRRLAQAVEHELESLNMKRARFGVSVEQSSAPDGIPLRRPGQAEVRCAFDATGVDQVEFLISPNPGEPLKPLAKIASGGEMARVMLALKTILCRADPVPTLIFDEIEAGVGGRGGQVVGEKLWQLTQRHQVICVSHLPHIACLADAHFTVIKNVVGGRTVTEVQRLEGEDRVGELAVMLGGAAAGPLIRQSAAEMLRRAQYWKAATARAAASA